MGKVTAIEKQLRAFLGAFEKGEKTGVTRKARAETARTADPKSVEARALLKVLGFKADAKSLIELGDAWLEVRMNEKAVEAYGQALALERNHFAAMFNRGLAYARLGKMEEALEDFGGAAGIDPEHVESFSNAAAVLAKLGRTEEALDYAQRAVYLGPHNAAALVNLGAILTRLGRADEGLAPIEDAIRLAPNAAKAWYDRACALAKLGRHDETRDSLARACELDSSMKGRVAKDPELAFLGNSGTES